MAVRTEHYRVLNRFWTALTEGRFVVDLETGYPIGPAIEGILFATRSADAFDAMWVEFFRVAQICRTMAVPKSIDSILARP